MNHTPGPWCYDGHDIWAPNDGNAVNISRMMGKVEQAPTNARLIAAAPDLLAACERVLRAINWSTSDDRLRPEEMADCLSAAIAKAKGHT